MRILDVTANKSSVRAIVEVNPECGTKGKVELKVHNPSVTKKKGATVELIKMSGYEYSHVEVLKNIITVLLDGFIDGSDVEEVLNNSKGGGGPRSNKVTSNQKKSAGADGVLAPGSAHT